MALNIEEIRSFRLKKLNLLKEKGENSYPAISRFNVSGIKNLKDDFEKLSLSKKSFAIVGRILAKREHGGSIFLDVYNEEKLQVFIGRDKVGTESFNLFSEAADVGDFAAFYGKLFYPKRKEPTMEAKKWEILAKSLRPLPEKWHGLQDVEERFRKRYLDILMNERVRERFLLRSRIVENLRLLLSKEGYVEVETPILQPLYGGALAEPFKTHHRMLDIDMFLRIAPELYLKRLLAAGFNKIYEVGKNFRNEGLDATHNPEFTTIELYAAYSDAKHLKDFIVSVLSKLIRASIKKDAFTFGGHLIEFPKKIPEVSFWRVIEKYSGISLPEKLSAEEFTSKAKKLGLSPEKGDNRVKVVDEIFKKICRPKMIRPVFVVDYPVEFSPLAKNLNGNPEIVDRFQMVIGGMELINGFSELNDPLEQVKRFEYQEKLRESGEKETQPMDEEFVEMLEYGMPPAAGLALSIDRFTMLLSDAHNVKEVILFPTMKLRRKPTL